MMLTIHPINEVKRHTVALIPPTKLISWTLETSNFEILSFNLSIFTDNSLNEILAL